MAHQDRMSRQEIYDYKRSILSFLRKNPDSSAAQVQQAVGGNFLNVNWHLRTMEKQGLLHRRKVDRSFIYRNRRNAFLDLKAEYSQPIQRSPRTSQHRTSWKLVCGVEPQHNSAEERVNDPLDPDKRDITGDVNVSAPQIMITINGEEKQLSLATAKNLYFKLKQVFGEN